MNDFFEYKDAKIEYLAMDNNCEKTLLFLHGFSGEFMFYEDIYKSYEGKYNIYAINMPTHGQSDIRPDLMNMEDFGEIVIKFVKEKNLSHIRLIGHSMGGGIAMTIAWKLGELVDKVILLGPMNRTMLMYNHLWPLFFPRNWEDYVKLAPILYFNHKALLANDEVIQRVEEKFSNEEVHKRLDVIYEWGYRMPQEKNQEIVDQGIAKCKSPIYLINGDHDGIVNVANCERHYKNLNNNVKSYVIKNSGHCMWVDNFDEFMSVFTEAIA